jgi:hypothetical protein
MSTSEKLPLSPMLVQYLVGLCALKWDAHAVNIDVKLGDKVPDEASGTPRDVDVTVSVDTPDGVYAFKGYEVKNWSTPLDVSDVDGLVTKFNDMTSVTHRAIVSASGFTEPAVNKAKHHGVDLYVIKQWTKPLEEQFPDLAPMSGLAAEAIRTGNFNLVWPVQNYWLGVNAPPFHIPRDGTLFGANGKTHPRYKNFGAYAEAIVVRSTGILWSLKPILERVNPLVEAFRNRAPMPEEPQWPYAHTLDVASDEVYIRASDEKLHRVDTFTLYGELRWEQQPVLYCVMENVPTGEIFAGAVVAMSDAPGRMQAIVFPAEGRDLTISNVQLEEKHLNQIQELKIAVSEGNSSPTE